MYAKMPVDGRKMPMGGPKIMFEAMMAAQEEKFDDQDDIDPSRAGLLDSKSQFEAEMAQQARRRPGDIRPEVAEEVFEQTAIEEAENYGPQGEATRTRLVLERRKVLHLPLKDKVPFYPHYRKRHDWDQVKDEAKALEARSNGEVQERATGSKEKKQAPEHFFSANTWSKVPDIPAEIVNLVRNLGLPKPSRIQSQAMRTLLKGAHAVLAEQAGSGKTFAYLLPLLWRHVLPFAQQHRFQPGDKAPTSKTALAIRARGPRLLIVTPTSDLARQLVGIIHRIAKCTDRWFRCVGYFGGSSGSDVQLIQRVKPEVLVVTPGRLRYLLFEDVQKRLDTSDLRAVVLDEVDSLLMEEYSDGVMVGLDELRANVPVTAQFVFVTATLVGGVRQELDAFSALPSITTEEQRKRGEKGLRWIKGPGLHKVSPNCEHILIDCTPGDLPGTRISAEIKASRVIDSKVLTLVWHLKQGILKPFKNNRIVIFCNSINNCRAIENALRKFDTRLKATGYKQWKVHVLHSLRGKDAYQKIARAFMSKKPNSADFFKKRILICTDRMSRGIDFEENPVKWVVLFDWPRDASEYIRRVGRTARSFRDGGVIALLSGFKELRMARQITSAAIRGVPLEGPRVQGSRKKRKRDPRAENLLEKNYYCLERFDPKHRDWRAPEAANSRPMGFKSIAEKKAQEEEEREKLQMQKGQEAKEKSEPLMSSTAMEVLQQEDGAPQDELQLTPDEFDELSDLSPDELDNLMKSVDNREDSFDPYELDADGKEVGQPWDDEDLDEDEDLFLESLLTQDEEDAGNAGIALSD